MIVVDASVIVDFLLGRPAALDAVEASLAEGHPDFLHAPELVEPETLNALRRLVRGRHVTARRADQAVSDLGELRLRRHPHLPLRARVWELRQRLTAYDASYLALAEAVEDPLLLTGDRGVADVARSSLGTAGVVLVA